MSENNSANQAALLRLVSSESHGVARLAKEMRVGPERLIALIRTMVDAGLLEVQQVQTKSPGRPRKRISPTPLGVEYLRAYDRLERMMLVSRRADLRKAARDGEYAGRLASTGAPEYRLFLELCEAVRHAGRSPS